MLVCASSNITHMYINNMHVWCANNLCMKYVPMYVCTKVFVQYTSEYVQYVHTIRIHFCSCVMVDR